MSRTDLEVNDAAMKGWADLLPNASVQLAAKARISVRVAKAIIDDGYVPSAKIRWCVSMATGIPEGTLWRPRAA